MKIRFLWWCINQPVNVRVFYRCGGMENESLISTGFMSRDISQTAFNRCSKREQEFIVWRDPVFKHFQDNTNA